MHSLIQVYSVGTTVYRISVTQNNNSLSNIWLNWLHIIHVFRLGGKVNEGGV